MRRFLEAAASSASDGLRAVPAFVGDGADRALAGAPALPNTGIDDLRNSEGGPLALSGEAETVAAALVGVVTAGVELALSI